MANAKELAERARMFEERAEKATGWLTPPLVLTWACARIAAAKITAAKRLQHEHRKDCSRL
jgi:hypothetical protein